GFISAVTMFTVSVAWGMIIFTTVLPIDNDLRALSSGVFAQPVPATERTVEKKLLERYPALKDIPAQERGRALSDKLRQDLMVGIPTGIWLGMLVVLIYAELGCVCSTRVAGALLRRYGWLRAVFLPYVEVAVATTALIGLILFALLEICTGQ